MVRKTISIWSRIIIVVIPLLYYYNKVFHQELMFCFTGLVAAILLIVSVVDRLIENKKSIRANFTAIDFAFVTFILYLLANGWWVSHGNFDYFICLKWAALVAVYILVRCISCDDYLMKFISISGTIQALIAIVQSSGLLDNGQLHFAVTGSFVNPAHLGGYLCVCLVVTICMLIRRLKDKTSLYPSSLLGISAALQCAALILADSRAAAVGLGLGLFVVLMTYFPDFSKRYKKTIILVLGITAVVGSVFMYNYRKGSADGRLLIWRVSCDMFAENPVFGKGVGQFGNTYMLYQANYFEHHPESRFATTADNVERTFNEFIHAGVELGIVGLVIFIILLILVFTAGNVGSNRAMKAGIAAWIGFSLFSYPANIFPVLLLLVIMVGGITRSDTVTVRINMTIACLLLFCYVFLAFISTKNLAVLTRTTESIARLTTGTGNDRDEAVVQLAFEKMKFNPTFNSLYFSWYTKDESRRPEPMKMNYVRPNCDIYLAVGSCYEKNDSPDIAASYYKTASYMIPNRITPNYFLWELYVSEGDLEEADKVAVKILNQQVKVESTYTIRVREKIKQYLAERSKDQSLETVAFYFNTATILF